MDERIEKDFIAHLVGRQQVRPSSAKVYIRNVKLFEKKTGKALDHVSSEDVVQRLADMKLKELKNPNTRRLMKNSLEIFYRWYSPIAGIPDPTKGLQKIRKYISHPKLIHPDELERMLHAMDQRNDDWGRRACAVIAFLADTGVRISELENLKAGDIKVIHNKKSGGSHFEATVAALKGTYSRVIPFANLVEGSLAEYFAKYYLWAVVQRELKPAQPLFFELGNHFNGHVDNMSVPLLRGGVNYLLARASYEAGIDRRIGVHQFRHFYGTYSVYNGMELFTLKDLMGHASVQTTQQYVHIADRLKGNVLKHAPTLDVKASLSQQGFAKIMSELAQKMR